ncbi:unnamed protein product [Paramecium pentaurelia]|uniref:Uncharacterized protein n=1 Tax=Paramecium pentaurelia TaxID=43138 RepID=A0A8S1XQ07_9CILI|nr:unnamed protein product [Paramecium pentaurelia]
MIKIIQRKQQLLFVGQYDLGKRQGEWQIVSQNSILGGGSYDADGLKNGKWTEVQYILSGCILIKETGEYQNGIKIGQWVVNWVEILTKNNKIIGGGNYDNNGIKQGLWQDLIEDFSEQNQLIYKGTYQDGVRIGEWIILSTKDIPNFTSANQYSIKVRGGGKYDQKGLKDGLWNEPCQSYRQKCEIFQNGEYKKGKKFGQWNITFKKKLFLRDNKESKFEEIGGGIYNDSGEKIGLWKELSDNFSEDSQIVLEGNYINCKKTGKWISKYRYSESNNFEIIGCENYDQNGLKSGLSKEVSENFSDSCQVIEIVQYQNGKKFGRSQIEYRKIHGSQFVQIGEGNYNQKGKKDGIWTELHYKFRDFCQVMKKGSYQNGIKQDNWDILFREFADQDFVKIGGGVFEKGVKNGQWTEIDDKFCRSRQIIQKLEYNLGQKVGRSEIFFRNHKTNDFLVIGKGQYDTTGSKHGEWLEPHEYFWEHYQLNWLGSYKFGVKQGLWQISKNLWSQPTDIIAGGTYDDDGNKDKKWTDLGWNCLQSSFILSEGEYSSGKKTGEWVLKLQVYDEIQQIGSCSYDDNGLKNGKCIDFDQNFFFNKCAYQSTYIHGIKLNDSREFFIR